MIPEERQKMLVLSKGLYLLAKFRFVFINIELKHICGKKTEFNWFFWQ